MVATEQQQGHSCAVQANHQVAVQLTGVAGGSAGIKNVTGHHYRIHRVRIDLDDEPVDKCLMLVLTALANEVLAEMPIRCVENAHGFWGRTII